MHSKFKPFLLHNLSVISLSLSIELGREMNFLLIFIITLIYSAESTLIDHLNPASKSYEGVGKYLNNLISDYNAENNEIHDVALVDLMTGNSSTLIDKVIESIPRENPIRLPRNDQDTGDFSIRKCAFVIVISDIVKSVSKKIFKNVIFDKTKTLNF